MWNASKAFRTSASLPKAKTPFCDRTPTTLAPPLYNGVPHVFSSPNLADQPSTKGRPRCHWKGVEPYDGSTPSWRVQGNISKACGMLIKFYFYIRRDVSHLFKKVSQQLIKRLDI